MGVRKSFFSGSERCRIRSKPRIDSERALQDHHVRRRSHHRPDRSSGEDRVELLPHWSGDERSVSTYRRSSGEWQHQWIPLRLSLRDASKSLIREDKADWASVAPNSSARACVTNTCPTGDGEAAFRCVAPTSCFPPDGSEHQVMRLQDRWTLGQGPHADGPGPDASGAASLAARRTSPSVHDQAAGSARRTVLDPRAATPVGPPDGDLVAEHDDLDRQFFVVPPTQPQQSEDLDEGNIE